jgi:hypothetical protein
VYIYGRTEGDDPMRKLIILAALMASTSAVWATADCEGPGPCGSDAEVIDNELSYIHGKWVTENLWCKEGKAPLYMNTVIIDDHTIQQGGWKCKINKYTTSDAEDTLDFDIDAKCKYDHKPSQKIKLKVKISDYGLSQSLPRQVR